MPRMRRRRERRNFVAFGALLGGNNVLERSHFEKSDVFSFKMNIASNERAHERLVFARIPSKSAREMPRERRRRERRKFEAFGVLLARKNVLERSHFEKKRHFFVPNEHSVKRTGSRTPCFCAHPLQNC